MLFKVWYISGSSALRVNRNRYAGNAARMWPEVAVPSKHVLPLIFTPKLWLDLPRRGELPVSLCPCSVVCCFQSVTRLTALEGAYRQRLSVPGRVASAAAGARTRTAVGTPAGPETEPGSCFWKSITIPFFSYLIMQLHETPIYRREATPAFSPVSTGFLCPDLSTVVPLFWAYSCIIQWIFLPFYRLFYQQPRVLAPE